MGSTTLAAGTADGPDAISHRAGVVAVAEPVLLAAGVALALLGAGLLIRRLRVRRRSRRRRGP